MISTHLSVVGNSLVAYLLFADNILFILLINQFGWLQEARSKELIDRILAVVNDDVISLYEFNREFRPFAQQVAQSDYPLSQKQEILEYLKRIIIL